MLFCISTDRPKDRPGHRVHSFLINNVTNDDINVCVAYLQIIHASQASYDNGCRIADASMNENIMCQKD